VTRLRIFGSIARGEARPDSDVDLAVEFAGAPSLVSIARLKAELEDRLDWRVDLVPWSALDPAMRAIVERDGVDVSA
jgi:predicted nucleotidyltransferase